MFSDPVVAVLVMLLLFFTGLMVMFSFVIRAVGAQRQEATEAFRKQQMILSDLERQFMEMSFTLRMLHEGTGAPAEAPQPDTQRAPHDKALFREEDDLLNMFEAAPRKKHTASLRDDHLLPPPSMHRSSLDDYDPAKDPHLFEDPSFDSPASVRYNGGRGGAARSGLTPPKRGN